MKIYSVTDKEFAKYGRIVNGVEVDQILKTLTEKTPCPENAPDYVAEEPELQVSRETIAQFDEYVKSFEKEAGIVSEPEFEETEEELKIEEPAEEPAYEAPKFELPDFLKK